jgi:hypothetical protein
MIETKVKVGAGVGAATGVAVWALVAFVPAFHSGLPQPIADALPFALAWIGHTVAAYRAPHTHRPDLPTPVGDVTGVTGGPLTGLPPSQVP